MKPDSEQPLNHLKDAPEKHLNHILTIAPDIFDSVDSYRNTSIKNKINRCPSWSFLSYDDWLSICHPFDDLGVDLVAAVISWSFTKGVYHFSQSLLDRLPPLEVSTPIPTEIFFRLPEWGVYVSNNFSSGFYANLVFSPPNAILNILIFGTDVQYHKIVLSNQSITSLSQITTNQTLDLCLRKLLYLCSYEPNIKQIDDQLPSRPRPIKTKSGWKLFPAKKIKNWMVGVDIKDGGVGLWLVTIDELTGSGRIKCTCKL